MNKYITNINIAFFFLLVIGAVFIFGGIPSKTSSQGYKNTFVDNAKQISLLEETRKQEVEKQNAIYEEHKQKVAELDAQINELKRQNKALYVLMGGKEKTEEQPSE